MPTAHQSVEAVARINSSDLSLQIHGWPCATTRFIETTGVLQRLTLPRRSGFSVRAIAYCTDACGNRFLCRSRLWGALT
jgi:hypothetical protein